MSFGCVENNFNRYCQFKTEGSDCNVNLSFKVFGILKVVNEFFPILFYVRIYLFY
jgi:hypothetical protein